MAEKHKCHCHLHIWAFGLAFGIVWAAALFIMGMIALPSHGYGMGFVQSIGNLYIGYHPGFLGSLTGALWGFVDAFIGFVIVAWIYNFFVGNKKCRCQKEG